MRETAKDTMKDHEKNLVSPAGLDVGTSRIALVRRVKDETQLKAQLNAFVNIPYSKFTEGVLTKERIPHTIRDSEIIVHGNESERFADLLQVEVRRPMARGLLNPQEPDGLERLREIVRILVGEANGNKPRICFSVPAPPIGEEQNLAYHEVSLRQILEGLGYQVSSINEGLAVVYSDLEDTSYTGIGISCGGGLCNVCLTYLSVPILSFSIPRAGDFIDQGAASVTGELVTRVRMAKEESFHFNGHHASKTHQALGVYYDEMIRSLVDSLKDALSKCRNLPKTGRPIPLVLSGGTTLPDGFRDRFEKALKESSFPINLSEVRLARNPLYATAQGALVSALVEQ